MQHAHRRAAEERGEQGLGVGRRRRCHRAVAQGDVRLQQPERIDGDAAAQKIDEVEGDFCFSRGKRLHRRQPLAVFELDPAPDRDIGQEAHPHRAGEFDLATRPGRKLGGDPVAEARRVADQPGDERDDENQNRKQAEEKPFPSQLARLHAVRPTRCGAIPKTRGCDHSCARPRPEDVLARLTGDSEPGAGIY